MIIVVEGIDGSGKTTLSYKMHNFLRKHKKIAYVVPSRSFLDFWKADAEEIFSGAKKLKSEQKMNMLSYSLWHCADFAYRWESEILPSLKNNKIVIMDRYIYTQIVRDTVRGLNQKYVESIYSFATSPNIIFYLTVDPRIALERIIKRQEEPGFYESGCDIHPKIDRRNSFIRFQTMCQDTYKKVFKSFPIKYLDGNKDNDLVASEAMSYLSSVMKIK